MKTTVNIRCPFCDQTHEHEVIINEPYADEEHECGVNGCSRSVDSPEDVCWQHEDDA